MGNEDEPIIDLRPFDDSDNLTEESVILEIPKGAAFIVFEVMARKLKDEAFSKDIKFKMSCRSIPDLGVPRDWSPLETVAAFKDWPDTQFVEAKSVPFPLDFLGIVPGAACEFGYQFGTDDNGRKLLKLKRFRIYFREALLGTSALAGEGEPFELHDSDLQKPSNWPPNPPAPPEPDSE